MNDPTAEITPEVPKRRAGRLSGLRRGGAMAGEAELAGARCLADSERRCLKEKHRETEKLTANTSGVVARDEEQGRGVATRGGGNFSDEIRNTRFRAWFH